MTLLRRHGFRIAVTFFAFSLALLGTLVASTELRLIGNALERNDVDEFYSAVPQDAVGPPGSLIKTEALLGAPFAARGWRIMYRTTDLNGNAQIATGVLVVPLTPPPPGGRTVVSWGHPTTGAAHDCAPSYGFDPYIGIEGLRFLLDRGYAVVATDYIGMGVAGPDSYLVGESAGHAVLDAVRAAQAVASAALGDDVVLWGHSQGGQAALFAAESAATYAPELDLRAVAVAAPAADLLGLMEAHLDDISGVTIGSYAFTAYAEVYGDSVPGAELDDILTPDALDIVPRMNELCLLTNIPELHGLGQPLVDGNFTTADPTKTSPWRELLAQNSAGSRTFDAPLFVAQGSDDELVVPADTLRFAQREAQEGIDVTYQEISFATHGTVAYLALPGMLQWLDRVLVDDARHRVELKESRPIGTSIISPSTMPVIERP
ncbi:alpha/beta fold hydrolase [Microbacterium sp. ET2]|uniref:alpha/beta fold hydrolase n=1 Tax=Microbacterium albipurpureum TaxID=3050384 RepID=UPI00259D1676|nr:alpha/beta fold hydrolase [Microbacterium sp. ET2 (Ac-2212)]WJL94255.1 alpha/beta fold hydrolase [Microbacterium sp. ET2 (Ac-2212)]